MKQRALKFVLNTGAIRKTHELDYNAYFAVLHVDNPALNTAIEEWDSPVFPVELATALYANAIRCGFLCKKLKPHETVVSAEFGFFCLCEEQPCTTLTCPWSDNN